MPSNVHIINHIIWDVVDDVVAFEGLCFAFVDDDDDVVVVPAAVFFYCCYYCFLLNKQPLVVYFFCLVQPKHNKSQCTFKYCVCNTYAAKVWTYHRISSISSKQHIACLAGSVWHNKNHCFLFFYFVFVFLFSLVVYQCLLILCWRLCIYVCMYVYRAGIVWGSYFWWG